MKTKNNVKKRKSKQNKKRRNRITPTLISKMGYYYTMVLKNYIKEEREMINAINEKILSIMTRA